MLLRCLPVSLVTFTIRFSKYDRSDEFTTEPLLGSSGMNISRITKEVPSKVQQPERVELDK
jgi:hypothetical protein